MDARFAWETLLRDEGELVRRAKVPGGWLVSHLLRSDPPVPPSLAFVPDEGHRWGAGQTPSAPPPGGFAKSASEVVATGGGGIVTTQAELDCFEVVRRLARQRDPDLEVGFLDTPTYFAVHLGAPTRWVLRICITPRSGWVAFNVPADLGPEQAAALLGSAGKGKSEGTTGPGGSVPKALEANWAGAVRYALSRPEDLEPLAPLLFAAIEHGR